MVQAVSQWAPTCEVRVQLQVSLCGICGGQIDTGQILSDYFGFNQSLSFHQRSILIFINTLPLLKGQTSEAWKNSEKPCYFGNLGAFFRKVLSLSL
jgi:hypothetical protein